MIYRRLTMSDCLHCDINELVRARLEQSEMIDLPELAGKMAESLVDLILLAPEAQQGQMLAEAISQLGNVFLEKSGAIEGESDTEHWGGFLAAKEKHPPGPPMTLGNMRELGVQRLNCRHDGERQWSRL
jgi:hypothetical protein